MRHLERHLGPIPGGAILKQDRIDAGGLLRAVGEVWVQFAQELVLDPDHRARAEDREQQVLTFAGGVDVFRVERGEDQLIRFTVAIVDDGVAAGVLADEIIVRSGAAAERIVAGRDVEIVRAAGAVDFDAGRRSGDDLRLVDREGVRDTINVVVDRRVLIGLDDLLEQEDLVERNRIARSRFTRTDLVVRIDLPENGVPVL